MVDYGGLGILTGVSLYYARKNGLNYNEKKLLTTSKSRNKSSSNESFFLNYLKNKKIENLSNDEVIELNKLLNIINLDKSKKIEY